MNSKAIKLQNLDQTIEIVDNENKYFYWISDLGMQIQSAKLIFLFQKPDLKAKISFKIVVKDSDNFDLNVLLKVLAGARNTDTYLKIDILQIGNSNSSSCRIIPSLEINENNVKAGHGASISRIDMNELYYMMSRGISLTESQDLIVKGFLDS